MQQAYIEDSELGYGDSYMPLNPTGRWKLDDSLMLYVEHKWLFLKYWVREDEIVFMEKRKFLSFIF